jgi:hypothetical protein
MCTKTPKPQKVEEKEVQYLRNPFLDAAGLGQNTGRNSLRIDRTVGPGIAGRAGLTATPLPSPSVTKSLLVARPAVTAPTSSYTTRRERANVR